MRNKLNKMQAYNPAFFVNKVNINFLVNNNTTVQEDTKEYCTFSVFVV